MIEREEEKKNEFQEKENMLKTEAVPDSAAEQAKKPKRRSFASDDTEKLLSLLIERITETDEQLRDLPKHTAKFDSSQLSRGTLNMRYRDQLRRLYRDILETVPSLSKRTAEKEIRTIVMAEKNRINRYGRKIADILTTEKDAERERIRINGWIETEYAAGRCPIQRFY